jgi:hypothetical protein
MSSIVQSEIHLLKKSLEKAVSQDNLSTSEEEVWDILQALKKIPMTMDLLRETMIGKALHEAKKNYTSSNKVWDEMKIIIALWKKACDLLPAENSSTSSKSVAKEENLDAESGRKSTRESKPVKFEIQTPKPPNDDVKTSDKMKPIPNRNEAGDILFPDYPNFRPNLTPKEVLQMGSFGGTYFRPISSKVTGQSYSEVWKELPEDWLKGLNVKTQIANSVYNNSINKYKDTCGGDLEMWESSGWIRSIDPYGWFMWYCRFYQGRRCSDDVRQIGRGNAVFGPTGRWRNNLANKVLASGLPYDKGCDKFTISPKIRQLLQHWGYKLTVSDLEKAAAKKK